MEMLQGESYALKRAMSSSNLCDFTKRIVSQRDRNMSPTKLVPTGPGAVRAQRTEQGPRFNNNRVADSTLNAGTQIRDEMRVRAYDAVCLNTS
ncbi:unnamed protein product [Boreogadus saida]